MKAPIFFVWLVFLSVLVISCSDSNLNYDNSRNPENGLLPFIASGSNSEELYYQFYIMQSNSSSLIRYNDSLYNIDFKEISHHAGVYLFNDAGLVTVGGTQLSYKGGRIFQIINYLNLMPHL